MASTSTAYNDRATMVFSATRFAYEDGYRYIINKGGTRSGKTYGVMQYLLYLSTQKRLRITVTSTDLPHIKRGPLQDWEQILETWGFDTSFDVNRSSLTWTHLRTGAKVEFATFDTVAKAKGPQRDVLMIDEANHVAAAIADHLATRTAGTVFLTYNPSNRFWADEKIIGRPNCKVIRSNYHDNPFLSREQVAEIESHVYDRNWWRVYGLGLDGAVEDSVYTNWDTITPDDMPSDPEATFYGLDWGYVNDPNGVVKVVRRDKDLYVRELLYKPGLLNDQIAEFLRAEGLGIYSRLVCDSAEQKSIKEINTKGLRAVGVKKGPDSIIAGIQVLKNYRIHVTEDSPHLIDELQKYAWQRDPITDELQNYPIDAHNHLLDALRYVGLTYLTPNGRRRGTVATTSQI